MTPEAQIIPIRRSADHGRVQPMRRAAGDGIAWPDRVLGDPWVTEGQRPSRESGTVMPRCRPPVRRLRPSVRVRRRRRSVLLGALALVSVLALGLPVRALAGEPSGAADAANSLRAGSTYTVRAGDTLWGIAERLDPGADPRVEVARLEAQLGSDGVYSGERIRLP